MSTKTIGVFLCGAVALGAIGAGITPAKAVDKLDLILQRLDTLEKENAALKNRLRRVEGTPAAPASRARATAQMGPPVAIAGGPMAGAMPIKAPLAFLCDRYGPGFYSIPGVPGTSGCLKVGGYIRIQAHGAPAATAFRSAPIPWLCKAGRDVSTPTPPITRPAAVMSLDARIATGWGDLRGYARFGAQVNSPFGNSIAPNQENLPVVFWDRGFIEYVGATIGKTRSFFDLFALTDGYLTYGNPRASGDTDLYGVLLAGYTARFGNGFSASVSVEDPNGHTRPGPSTWPRGS